MTSGGPARVPGWAWPSVVALDAPAVAALNVAMIAGWKANVDDGAAAPRARGPADRRWRVGVAVGLAVAISSAGAVRGVPVAA